MRRLPRFLLATSAGFALALFGVAGAGAIGLRPSVIGETRPTAVEQIRPAGVTSPTGLVPLTPCRVLDTRQATAGKLTTTADRVVQVSGSSGFSAQGGAANGCGVPVEATAVAVSISAVGPTGAGYLRAWPHGVTPRRPRS